MQTTMLEATTQDGKTDCCNNLTAQLTLTMQTTMLEAPTTMTPLATATTSAH